MATEELKVKFKVDTGEVKSGADEAKNKVKQATSQMASDTKQASASMSSSMKDVQRATDGVAGATKTATTAVKQMEGQVSQSAQKMSGELGKVAEQIKGISGRQIANIGARGLGMAGSAVNWAANNLAEEGSDTQAALKVGGAALTGAGSGVMMGAAIGSIVPIIGTAVGAAVGGAVGALAGAASELWEASSALKKSAEERQQAAQKTLQQAGNELRERDKVAGWNKENQVLLNGLGKTWWQSKDGTRSITGEERVFKVQEARQAELDRAVKERDEFVRAHQYDTGEEATRSAITFNLLEKAVNEAAQHLQALSPVVEAAKRSEADKAKAVEQVLAQADKEARAREAAAAKATEAEFKDQVKGKQEEIKESDRTIASLQSQLQGVIGRPAQSPTDALTRIGGGRGYSGYNNSTANIQQKIENNLRQLIKVQEEQSAQLHEDLQTLISSRTEATWAS